MSFKAPVPQHIEALNHAREIRVARQSIKRHLQAQDTRKAALGVLADYLVNLPPCLHNATVYEMVAACHQSGDVLAQRVCARVLGVTELKTLGQLTPRQADLFIKWLRDYESLG